MQQIQKHIWRALCQGIDANEHLDPTVRGRPLASAFVCIWTLFLLYSRLPPPTQTLTHAHTHTRMHTRTHACTHAHAHTYTQILPGPSPQCRATEPTGALRPRARRYVYPVPKEEGRGRRRAGAGQGMWSVGVEDSVINSVFLREWCACVRHSCAHIMP